MSKACKAVVTGFTQAYLLTGFTDPGRNETEHFWESGESFRRQRGLGAAGAQAHSTRFTGFTGTKVPITDTKIQVLTLQIGVDCAESLSLLALPAGRCAGGGGGA